MKLKFFPSVESYVASGSMISTALREIEIKMGSASNQSEGKNGFWMVNFSNQTVHHIDVIIIGPDIIS